MKALLFTVWSLFWLGLGFILALNLRHFILTEGGAYGSREEMSAIRRTNSWVFPCILILVFFVIAFSIWSC